MHIQMILVAILVIEISIVSVLEDSLVAKILAVFILFFLFVIYDKMATRRMEEKSDEKERREMRRFLLEEQNKIGCQIFSTLSRVISENRIPLDIKRIFDGDEFVILVSRRPTNEGIFVLEILKVKVSVNLISKSPNITPDLAIRGRFIEPATNTVVLKVISRCFKISEMETAIRCFGDYLKAVAKTAVG